MNKTTTTLPPAESFPVIEGLLADLQNARQINLENLRTILRDNQGTAYGQRYGFARLSTEADFRAALPLTEYSAYQDLAGNPAAFTAYPVQHLLLTSGSTGRQKEFCITQEALRRYSSYIYEMPYFLLGSRTGPHLHVSVFRPAVQGKALLSTAYYEHLLDSGALDCSLFPGGQELLFSSHVQQVLYVKLWLALSCPELVSIQSIFLYDVLLLFAHLENHWREILADLRMGEPSAPLHPTVRARLLANRPDTAAVDRLENILSAGFDAPIARRLWPNLRFISGIGGEMYAFQGEALARYTGDVPFFYFTYTSSECMSGVALSFGAAEYVLLPRSAYYEFLTTDGRCIPLHEVQAGAIYELVVTTFSGLYRYKTSDLLQITGFSGEAPRFRVVGRRGHYLNEAGEKLDEATVREAIRRWADELRLKVSDCSVGIDESCLPCRYCLFAETGSAPADSRAAVCFDRILRGLSPDYDDIRSLGMLNPPQVVLTHRGGIAQTLSQTCGPAHSKPRLFLTRQQAAALVQWSVTHGKQQQLHH